MNTDFKEILTVINPNVLDVNKKTFETMDYYKKARSIIERTNIALGKKKKFKEFTISTINSQFNINATKSTQKI